MYMFTIHCYKLQVDKPTSMKHLAKGFVVAVLYISTVDVIYNCNACNLYLATVTWMAPIAMMNCAAS